MAERRKTIIVGGGQAGLALSYCLKQEGIDHLVLEAADQPGEAWRNHRWDSFTLVTPNWHIRLPGAEYQGDDPDGFMPRKQVVSLLEDYVQRYQLPVQFQTRVTSVSRKVDASGYQIESSRGAWEAGNVVIATGSFQTPKIPAFSQSISPAILQIHSGQYRNPGQLPPGAVLVVGSAQSGCQVAEELYQVGRKVFLSVGSAGRLPRRYRGQDITRWLYPVGFFDRTLDMLPSPQARFAGNPHITGKDGGHTLNLHQFARDGVTLLGHIQGGMGETLSIAPDVKENLAKADKFEADIITAIDEYIRNNRIDAPIESLPALQDGYQAEEIDRLNLEKAGITSIIWASGYTCDFSLVQLPILDDWRYPLQERGITAYPGLFFVGLHWLHSFKSGIFMGVGEDAAYVAEHIANRQKA
ncbi:MAG: FAD-dependent oxidoreductase [Chloroflexota bacterium]|nr:MAG: FAD-dependent oxidoreductase [Chloroflexota bacterium]